MEASLLSNTDCVKMHFTTSIVYPEDLDSAMFCHNPKAISLDRKIA